MDGPDPKYLELIDAAGKHHWHHSIDLGNGVVTPGYKSAALCRREAQSVFDRIDLRGRSVLDVGTWNGYFAFEAERRGAARVLATDSFCWTDANFRGRETFNLARSILGSKVEALEIDAAELSIERVGEFDIVLFLGVFYHRFDALDVLRRVAGLAKYVLVVETHLDLRQLDRPAMALYPRDELAGDSTNWWGPNEHCMKALLEMNGFDAIEIGRSPAARYSRGIFHAWRSAEIKLAPLPKRLKLRRWPPLLHTPAAKWLIKRVRGK